MTTVTPSARHAARRSCLSVPGHAVRMHAKALEVPADEVVFDLEDAVAPAAKPQARDAIAQTLAAAQWRERTVAVRVNAPGSDELAADLELIATLTGVTVVVPKVQRAQDLEAIAQQLGPEVGLQALIETPAGIEAAPAIAAATPSLYALILGYADLAGSLGRRGAERDLDRWLYHQEAVLAAARAAGVQAIDGPFLRLGDRLSLARAARAARELGYDGKWAIHPEQVEVLNQAFAATEPERRWAGAVQDALSEAAGSGDAAVRVDGAMVDEAMRAQARRLLALPRRPQPESAPALDGPPFYEDLAVGVSFRAPGLTITDGMAALHQAIVGDRLRLALDGPLCRDVTGAPRPLAHPMLVCDVAIGQSTQPSGRVLGNLFYRGLAARPLFVGETLRTLTTVVAKRRASSGATARGMVLLHVEARDAAGAVVLDYHRCPLLPARAPDPDEAGDDLQAAADAAGARTARDVMPDGWWLEALRHEPLGPLFSELAAGQRWRLEAGETVSCAPELARLSLNLAMTHTDATAGAHGQRLVYGGQVIGVAAAHLTRVLPDLGTILAWRSCDHLGPTFEGDLLRSEIELEELEPLPDGGLLHARVRVSAQAPQDDDPRPVLDWRLSALMP